MKILIIYVMCVIMCNNNIINIMKVMCNNENNINDNNK